MSTSMGSPSLFTTLEPLTIQSERGSLALTKDGPVLGFPRDLPMPERVDAAHRVTDWLNHGGLLTLPFPVDVEDIR